MSVHVSSRVWKFQGLPWAEKLVLLKLADTANDEGASAYPAVSTIVRETGLSERKVFMCLKSLREMGILQAEGIHNRRRTVIYQINLEALDKKFTEELLKVNEGAHGAPLHAVHPCTPCTYTPAHGAPNTSLTVHNPHSPPLKDETLSEEFATVWAAWEPFEMHKGNFSRAQRKYENHRREGVDAEAIRYGAERYVKVCRQTRCKTQHLDNWLHVRGWEAYRKMLGVDAAVSSGERSRPSVPVERPAAREIETMTAEERDAAKLRVDELLAQARRNLAG